MDTLILVGGYLLAMSLVVMLLLARSRGNHYRDCWREAEADLALRVAANDDLHELVKLLAANNSPRHVSNHFHIESRNGNGKNELVFPLPTLDARERIGIKVSAAGDLRTPGSRV